jgi:hypothetical protein
MSPEDTENDPEPTDAEPIDAEATGTESAASGEDGQAASGGGEQAASDGDGGTSDGKSDSISDIERILLDPDKLVQMLAYNGQADIGQKSKAVYSLRPPFGETVEPTLKHLDEDSTDSKADDEIHMRPFRFVVEGRQVIEQRPTREVATEELDAEDPTDAAINSWIDEAMLTWKEHVRENLAESVDIFSPHGMSIVSVEYASEE